MRPATLPSRPGLWKSGTVRCRQRETPTGGLLAVAVAAAALASSACAKSQTDVLTLVSADATVPPILILRVTVAGATGQSMGSLRSMAVGDAADRPAPFSFPLSLPVTADPTLAGPVTITIDGLDWDTYAVIASGSAPAQVVPEQETAAAVTLAAVPGGAGADGGTPDAGAGASDAGGDL